MEGDPELIPENNRHPDPYFDSYPGGARPPQDFAAPGPQRARNSAALCVVTPPSLPVSDPVAGVAQEHLRGSEHAFNAHGHCLSVTVNVVPYRPNLGSGMEEVAGSILTRSTIHLYSRFREQSLCLRVLFQLRDH